MAAAQQLNGLDTGIKTEDFVTAGVMTSLFCVLLRVSKERFTEPYVLISLEVLLDK